MRGACRPAALLEHRARRHLRHKLPLVRLARLGARAARLARRRLRDAVRELADGLLEQRP